MRNKLLLLLVLFSSQFSYSEVILYNRIVNPNSISYQCNDVKDAFAVKTLKLLEDTLSSDLLYEKLWIFDTNNEPISEKNIDCISYLDKKFQYLQGLAVQKNGFADVLLLQRATYYLSELYSYNPFDKRERLVLLIKENIDKDKPIYPYLLEKFRYR